MATYDDGSWDNGIDPQNPYPDQSVPQADPFVDQLNALYQQYYGRAATPEEIQAHRGNPGGLAAVEQMLKTSQAPPPKPNDPEQPPPGGDPSVKLPPNAPGLTDYYDKEFNPPPQVLHVDPNGRPDSPTPGTPYIPPTPTAPPTPTYSAPTFPGAPKAPGAPAPFSYEDFTPGQFKAPSAEEALNDPGYKFRVGQGEDALQRWAAARGTLNDSGTATGLIDYGQNAASQEYRNVWNRDYNAFGANEGSRFNAYMANRSGALQAYNTNYGTQVVDPYAREWQQFQSTTLDPTMAAFGANVGATGTAFTAANNNNTLGYSTQAAAGQHQNDMNYLNAWNAFLNDQNYFSNWQDRTFDKMFRYAQA